MKKIVSILLLFIGFMGYSQTNGITYQAVIFNPSGEQLPGVNNANAPLANKNICLRFTIIDHNSQPEYIESIQTTTDEFGMVNLIIGTGLQLGGYATSFSNILWNANPKNLKVDLSATGVCAYYTEISNQPFTSVPFALYAVNSESTAAIAALQATVAANATATTTALATKENTANKSTTTTLGTSNVLFPTQNAVKTYVDTNISTVNASTTALQATVAANAAATTTALATKEDAANKSTTTTLGTSNVLFPTQNAVKTYVDTNITSVNASNTAAITTLGNTVTSNAAATTTALATKEDAANKSNAALGTSTTLFPTQNAVKTYVDTNITSVNASNTAAITTLGNTVTSNAAATTTALGLKEDAINKSTTTTLGTSNVLFPTQNAVKTYVDTNLASKADAASLATVAISGSYNDLSNRPSVPAAYSLPNASASTLGGIKVGSNLSIDSNGVLSGVSSYSLPNASTSTLGGIKVGSNLSIDSNGVLSGVSSYSLPTASASELGGVKVGSGLTITNGVLSASGSGVPYTGATQAVDLGAFDLKVNGITVGRGNGNLASNTATGKDALLSNNTIGANNTAMGNQALYSNTFGSQNTAIGSGSLKSNINGIQNTAVGILSLEKNVGVSYNTAVGAEALRNTVDGESNTATGASALKSNISGAYNSAFGRNALVSSTASYNNAAFGAEALSDNLANGNTAYGAYALQRNTTGYSNTAVGIGAMKFHSTGNDNVAIGVNAGLFASNQTTGSNNTAVGAFAEYGAANLTNATVIGSGATVSASNTIQLGNTAVTNVKTSGTITAGAVTYPKVDGTTGQVLTANANGIPTWQTIATSPLVSPNFTGTPTAPTATAGTNTTQIATTQFVTSAIATATIADATTSAKGKIQLAGDLGGTAAAPTVPGLALKAPIATPTFTGTVTAPIYASAPQNLTSGTAISWNPNAGLNANLTLAHNGTLSFSTAPTAGSYGTLVITQDATGGRTLTLPSGTNLVLGSTSTTTVSLSTDPNVKDILNFYFDGTTYFWNIGKGFGTTATFTANSIAGGAAGAIPYQTGGGVTGFLARGTDGQILTLASGLPSWADAPVTGVTSATSPLSIASNVLSLGTVTVANGGTGLTSAPANGQIDIGNGIGFARATLTAGTGVTITNGAGSITINASARSWTDQPTVSANQTTFTLTYAPTASSKIWMFINGVRTNNNAYSFSGTTVTYVPANNGAYAITANDRVQFDYTY